MTGHLRLNMFYTMVTLPEVRDHHQNQDENSKNTKRERNKHSKNKNEKNKHSKNKK